MAEKRSNEEKKERKKDGQYKDKIKEWAEKKIKKE